MRPTKRIEKDFLFLSHYALRDDLISLKYQKVNQKIYLDFLATTSGKALNETLFNVFNAFSFKTSSAIGKIIVLLREARDL